MTTIYRTAPAHQNPVQQGNNSGHSYAERLTQDGGTPDEMLFEVLRTERLDTALAELPDREAKVLRLYFGLDDGREWTLEEAGALFGVTRERARQLRDRALRRLRESRHAAALADYAMS